MSTRVIVGPKRIGTELLADTMAGYANVVNMDKLYSKYVLTRNYDAKMGKKKPEKVEKTDEIIISYDKKRKLIDELMLLKAPLVMEGVRFFDINTIRYCLEKGVELIVCYMKKDYTQPAKLAEFLEMSKDDLMDYYANEKILDYEYSGRFFDMVGDLITENVDWEEQIVELKCGDKFPEEFQFDLLKPGEGMVEDEVILQTVLNVLEAPDNTGMEDYSKVVESQKNTLPKLGEEPQSEPVVRTPIKLPKDMDEEDPAEKAKPVSESTETNENVQEDDPNYRGGEDIEQRELEALVRKLKRCKLLDDVEGAIEVRKETSAFCKEYVEQFTKHLK
jgi:hypothetical protein